MEVIAAAAIIGGVVLAFVFFYFVPLGLWVQAWTSGAHVGIGTLLAMRLPEVDDSLRVVGLELVLRRGGMFGANPQGNRIGAESDALFIVADRIDRHADRDSCRADKHRTGGDSSDSRNELGI